MSGPTQGACWLVGHFGGSRLEVVRNTLCSPPPPFTYLCFPLTQNLQRFSPATRTLPLMPSFASQLDTYV